MPRATGWGMFFLCWVPFHLLLLLSLGGLGEPRLDMVEVRVLLRALELTWGGVPRLARPSSLRKRGPGLRQHLSQALWFCPGWGVCEAHG